MPLPAFEMTTTSGHSWRTSMAKGITLAKAKKYFLGKKVNVVAYPKEKMEKVVKVIELKATKNNPCGRSNPETMVVLSYKMDRTPLDMTGLISWDMGEDKIKKIVSAYVKKHKITGWQDVDKQFLLDKIWIDDSPSDRILKQAIKTNPPKKRSKSVVKKKRSGKLSSSRKGAKTMASRKQIAAARRNIKKAQRKRRTPAQKAASKRNIKKAIAANRRKGRKSSAKRKTVKRRVVKRRTTKRRAVKRRTTKKRVVKRRVSKKRVVKRKGPKKAHKGERKGQHVKRGSRYYVVVAGRLLRKSSAAAAKRAKASKRRKR